MTSSYFFQEGTLFCEAVSVEKLINALPDTTDELPLQNGTVVIDVPKTPVFIYSSATLKRNVGNYTSAMEKAKINGRLGYAVKANGNIGILKTLKEHGVEMLVTVSGNEIITGIKAGFQPQNIIYNGNGKQEWEIKLAMQLGTILNVDSKFDAKMIAEIHNKYFTTKEVTVFLRIRPTAAVHKKSSTIHPYVNTAECSKFGFDMSDLDAVLGILHQEIGIKIEGIHCHLGSCIFDPEVYRSMGEIMTSMAHDLKDRGHVIRYLDIGGGIGINYNEVPPGLPSFIKGRINRVNEEPGPDTKVATTEQKITDIFEFMEAIAESVPKEITVIFEPGRSLVANSGILVCKVLGSKTAGTKRFVVVDASMAEIIRPCLYGSHHQIYPTTLPQQDAPWLLSDVVGPICETADFIGKDIPLPISDYLAVLDVGAYCSSMSSNYNMRPRPAEILIDGSTWSVIRTRDKFDQLSQQE